MPSSLLGRYLSFLRSPSLIGEPASTSAWKAFKDILRLYSLHLLLVIVLGSLITLIPGIQDGHKLGDVIEELSALALLATVVLWAPLVEECIFRLPLRPFALNLSLAGSAIALVGLPLLLTPAPSLMRVFVLALLAFNLYLWVRRSRSTVFNGFYASHPRVIFYFVVLAFGVLHITNFDLSVWPLVPFLVLPQVVVGLWLGFVRLRYGFHWAFFAHAFHNGCLVLPVLLAKVLGKSALIDAESVDLENLSLTDSLLSAGIGLYSVGGLMVAAVAAWLLVKEWQTAR